MGSSTSQSTAPAEFLRLFRRGGGTRSICLTLWVMWGLAASAQTVAVRLDVQLQKHPYNLCLPASVSMVLSYWGVDISATQIGDQVAVYKDGTTGGELRSFVEKMGFRGFLIQPSLEDLLLHVEKGRPVIIVLPSDNNVRHAMVMVGVDGMRQQVWLNDPATGNALSVDIPSFRRRWTSAGHWTFLILPK